MREKSIAVKPRLICTFVHFRPASGTDPYGRISRIRLTDSLLATGIIEELKTVLLQVNQTIAFQSGIQALSCPEGFAPSLAPIVQKYLKASPCVMVHVSKHFAGIPVVEVVTPCNAPTSAIGLTFDFPGNVQVTS